MKKHTFIRSTYWDENFEYDVYNRSGGNFNGSIHTEHSVYVYVLLEEGIIDYRESDCLNSATLADLERICLENNIYIEILDEVEE